MNLDQFLANLAAQGIIVQAAGDRLQVQHQNETLPPEIQTLLEDFEEEILGWLADGAAKQGPLLQAIPNPAARYEPFPLTDIQQSYWVARSGGVALGDVGIHVYLELTQPGLDLSRLNQAWQRLVAHHDVLRTVATPDGQQQVLAAVPAYQISVTDLRGQPTAVVDEHIAQVRDVLAHQLLPADQWPLFDIRATLLADDEVRLHLSLDAFCYDLSGLLQIFNQWQKLYADLRTPLSTPPLSFRDYVLAERQLEDTAAYAQARDYWLNRLPTLPPAPQLPLARPIASLERTRFQRRVARLAAAQWHTLQTRAHAQGLTPTGVLLAAFAEVLTRWSQSPRFTLNLTIFNRLPVHPQVDELIGDFTILNLLAIDNTAVVPFIDHAKAIQQQLWTDLEQRAFSGVRVIRELARQQGLSGQMLMPIVFTSGLHLTTNNGFEPFGQALYSTIQTPQVLLDHIVIEEAGALSFSWNTVDDLFPPGLIDDMFTSYCDLLAQLAADGECWQMPHPVQLPAAQRETQRTVNATVAPMPDVLLHTLFQQQVAAQADAPAVIAPTQALTYGELNRRATTVARWLRTQGIGNTVGAQPLVAVVMQKGWEQIVGVLGTLLAGAAYLPIDSDLPQERLWYLLENGEVQCVLTQSWLDAVILPTGVARLAVDQQPDGQDNPTDADPTDADPNNADKGLSLARRLTPDDLACVIYTSGSTGLPKGVMLTHRGIVNAILATNQSYGIGRGDAILALTPLIHDMSMYDLFGLLAAGGAIIIPAANQRRDPAHWAALLTQQRITIWNSVPAMMEMLLVYAAETPALKLPDLRLAFLGGDWIGLTIPERLRRLAPHAQLVSVGGPTETTLWNIWYPVQRVEPHWPSIPYGHPLANTRYFILNERLEDCPLWSVGQMYVAGVGVAAGYWRDAARTAEKFITHPVTGVRLYATGDLGRYLPDGEIEFIGRNDLQVKMRGRRIELGEVEAALLQHPFVRQAVVTVVGAAPHQQLAAHVVLTPDALPNAQPMTEAADYGQLGAPLQDKTERIAFKLQEKGIRVFPAGADQLPLAKPPVDETLLAAYLSRQSYRQFLAEPIPYAAFSQWLGCLMQLRLDNLPLPKYRYPSGGGLYPLHAYLFVKPDRVEGISAGFYYYQPKEHSLIRTDVDAETTPEGVFRLDFNQTLFDRAAFTLFLVGDMAAIAPMYGEAFANELCLLEAGYISQLLMSEAPGQEIGLCPIGSFTLEKLKRSLGLTQTHRLFHTLVGGRIAPAQQRQWLQPAGSGQWQTRLQEALRQTLPDYMVPTLYKALEALPLTANGKVDRKALAAFDLAPQLVSAETIAPASEIEQTIAALLQEILQVEQVSVTSNFFDLGANSVHIVQLYNRLTKTLNDAVSVVDLFTHSTIRSLAHHISQSAHAVTEPSLTPTEKRGLTRRMLRQQASSRATSRG